MKRNITVKQGSTAKSDRKAVPLLPTPIKVNPTSAYFNPRSRKSYKLGHNLYFRLFTGVSKKKNTRMDPSIANNIEALVMEKKQ